MEKRHAQWRSVTPISVQADLLRVAKKLGVDAKTLSAEAAEVLARYGWPGKVRELVNLCRCLTVLAPASDVQVEDLFADITSADPALHDGRRLGVEPCRMGRQAFVSGGCQRLDEALPQFEKTLIRIALKHARLRSS